MTGCIVDLYCMTTGTVKLTTMTMVTIVTVTSSTTTITTTTTIIIGALFSFLLLILSVYHGHVMMSVMLMSTLARWCHESWQHAHNTVNDISHSECSVLINFTSSLKWSSFQSKGADRKLKVEMQKLEHKAKEELVR